MDFKNKTQLKKALKKAQCPKCSVYTFTSHTTCDISKYLIYALVDPRDFEVRYVGRSSSGLKRPKGHSEPGELNKNINPHKKNWIKQLLKLGHEPVIIVVEEVLEVKSKEKVNNRLNSRERYWIKRFRDIGSRLTNATDGGEGVCGFVPSEESRLKHSRVMSAHFSSKETRIKASRLNGGLPFFDQYGKMYETIAEAAHITGLSKGNVCGILKGYNVYVGGYVFRYENDSRPWPPMDESKRPLRIRGPHELEADKNKDELLEYASSGKPRPNAKTKLGARLCKYTNPNQESYDPEFDKKIRELRPDWFIGQSDGANKKKELLMEMAKNREPRPSSKTKLGASLCSYTSPSPKNRCYDPEFDAEIRALRPDWFK